jgi:2-pyrone-4,6-dicarboxylate lactonase
MPSEMRVIYPPHPNPRKPDYRLPAGSCDSHFHIFGPPEKFPYGPTRVYIPPAAPLAHYHNLMEVLGIDRGVVVQPNAHGFDNAVSLDAIARSNGRLRGVIKADDRFTADDFSRLHDQGVRGVRFNLIPGNNGKIDIAMFETVIARIAPLGWSATFHCLPSELMAVADWLRGLDITVIIDHFGRVNFADGVGQDGFQCLLGLMAQDHVWTKISCAERLTAQGPPYHDAVPFARALLDIAPGRLLWGTDWPHTQRFKPGQQPDDGDLVDLIPAMVPDEETRRMILVDNPTRLFWPES